MIFFFHIIICKIFDISTILKLILDIVKIVDVINFTKNINYIHRGPQHSFVLGSKLLDFLTYIVCYQGKVGQIQHPRICSLAKAPLAKVIGSLSVYLTLP